jgi:2-polyprenyl-3-methyl-5-hydroxy-6-metoxy-1,4-benzoquinol methylase
MRTRAPLVDLSRNVDERSWWDFWNTSYRAKDNQDETSNELFAHTSALINNVTQNDGGRVLEVACGTGTLSRLLAFSNYHGLDISAAAIEIACQKGEQLQLPVGTSRPTYETADFHEWRLPSVPFDLVVCVDAISCFRDPPFVLRKIAQSLRAHGRLVLTTVNPFVYTRIRRTPTNPLESGPVSRWLSGRELHVLIKSAGLTIERSCTIMPRGNSGILRLINARRLNRAFGPRSAAALRRLKEKAGLGQYRLVVARKETGA